MKNKHPYLSLIIFIGFLWGQLPESFTKLASNNNYGNFNNVAIGIDGTLFAAKSAAGLWAYIWNDTGYVNTAIINDGGFANDLVIGPDGTIFLANGYDGIRAYIFDGTSFINTAHIRDGGFAKYIELGTNNEIIVSTTNIGLRAYLYDGASFALDAYYFPTGAGKFAVSSNNVIYKAGRGGGLIAITYDSSSFNLTAQIDVNGWVRSVALYDGYIFIIASGGGVFAYTFNDSAFTNVGSVYTGHKSTDIAISPDGTIFTLGREGQIKVFTFDGSNFYEGGMTYNLGAVENLYYDNEGLLYLSLGVDGISAFTYADSTFELIRNLDDTGKARMIRIDENGTIFLWNNYDGIRGYNFDGTNLINTLYYPTDEYLTGDFEVGPNNLLYTFSYDLLNVYSYNNASITLLDTFHLTNYYPSFNISSDGTLFFYRYYSALVAFDYSDSGLTEIAETELPSSWIEDIDVGPDNTIFTVGYPSELSAYEFNNSQFINTANFDISMGTYIDVSPDNIVFTSSFLYNEITAIQYTGSSFSYIGYTDFDFYPSHYSSGPDQRLFTFDQALGLYAYQIIDTSFVQKALMVDPKDISDIAVNDDGIVFVASQEYGLVAYSYSGYLEIDKPITTVPKSIELKQNYPNPFNPTTTIKYELPKTAFVKIAVYDIAGRIVTTLVDRKMTAGFQSVVWDGTDQFGKPAASGMYIYQIQADDPSSTSNHSFIRSGKMVLLK